MRCSKHSDVRHRRPSPFGPRPLAPSHLPHRPPLSLTALPSPSPPPLPPAPSPLRPFPSPSPPPSPIAGLHADLLVQLFRCELRLGLRKAEKAALKEHEALRQKQLKRREQQHIYGVKSRADVRHVPPTRAPPCTRAARPPSPYTCPPSCTRAALPRRTRALPPSSVVRRRCASSSRTRVGPRCPPPPSRQRRYSSRSLPTTPSPRLSSSLRWHPTARASRSATSC